MIKLLSGFLIAFSLASLPGPISSNFHLPIIQPASANLAPAEKWLPSGPAMDTELAVIFTDDQAEFTNFQSPSPNIDLTDSPLTPDLPGPLISSPNFFITSQVSLHAYYDIQFMLANNFWGCDFNYGNSACGIQIRQGIAHMIDRANFAANEPSIAGMATAIDSPVPPNNGGLPAANPCAWDSSNLQSGSHCIVGAPGGTAYHLANATGANGISWLPAPGSADMNAAAQHFVSAGIATGFNPGTSVLTGIGAAAGSHTVNFFIRGIPPVARQHLGDSIAEQVCYLFTGAYNIPCAPYVGQGPPLGGDASFPGRFTSTTAVNLSWGIYIAINTDSYPFDDSLYHTYNSQFVSGISSIKPPTGSCSSSSVPTSRAADYVYLCNQSYDSISSQMEFAPCLTSPGDPAVGQPNNTPGGTCPGTTQLSAISAGIQSEDAFGKGAYTIPVFTLTGARFGYLSNWQRVIDGDGTGIPNYFTWLNAYSPNPAVAGTVRQGFSGSTVTLNPYLAETPRDFYMIRNIYDSLAVKNPMSSGQLVDWMILGVQQLSNSSLTYFPPASTQQTFRFTLRNDMFFQDGRKVTSFDVAFTYLSMMADGAYQSATLSNITGFTILAPSQFDVNVKNVGPFSLLFLTSPTILPGHYWNGAGSAAWDSGISSCTMQDSSCYPAQYTLGPIPATGAPSVLCNSTLSCAFPAANLNVDPNKIIPTFDPLAAGILVGSGPWQCGTVTVSGSGNCSSSGAVNPPVGGSYTLSRFGKGLSPASSVSGVYFRSNGNLALWIWSEPGDIGHDFLTFSVVAACFGAPVTSSGACAHFQQGIGANGGPIPVGLSQVSIVNRFVGLNWAAPLNWASSPPVGIIPLAPVLYENTITLNPASVAGCTNPYPTGGYDC